jgi:hypothetical protein
MKSVSKEAGSGRGLIPGPTLEQLLDYEEEGLTTERKIKRGDYGKPGMAPMEPMPKPKTVKKASGGSVSSASSRADGCAQRGKTKGRIL